MSGAPSRCIVCGDAPRPVQCAGGIRIVRSPGCGLEWQDPFPDEGRLRALYGARYQERWGAGDADALERVRAMKRASFRAFLGEIRRHRSSGRLLDVGCAAGFLLEEARAQGFDPWGLDPSAEAVEIARRRFGDRVREGGLDADAFPGVGFDVVTLIDVFEHAADPARLLDAVRGRLVPKGVLAAVLPNAASLTRRLLGRRWPHYVAEHLFHWSPGNLSRFLAERGWAVLALRTGIRKTFTGRYLVATAASAGSWLPPGVGLLGDHSLRVATGEMLVVATPQGAPAR